MAINQPRLIVDFANAGGIFTIDSHNLFTIAPAFGDEYAILSMAQTRAIGKAFRNLIGWVIKMAGYESTPAEEMSGKTIPLTKNGNGEGNKETKPQIGKIEELKSMLKGTSNGEKLVDLKKRLGIVLEDWNITEKHASGIIMQLLNKETKK